MRQLQSIAALLVPIALACNPSEADEDDADSSSGPPTTTVTTAPTGPTSTASTATDGDDCGADPASCGICDPPCADGLACIDGTCGLACGPGSTACGDHCTDTQSDPAHCGGCDMPCDAGVPCIAGVCTPDCGDGELDCDGTCVDARNDESNCGGCGMTCTNDAPCVYGECVATTLHHTLITGQSLSTGAASTVVSTVQPYNNVMLNTGVRAGGVNLTSFVPLVETTGAGEGETIASGFANLLTESTGGATTGIRTLASAHGVSGQPYAVLRKGTTAYANGMAQVTAGAMLAAAASETYTVRAVTVIHGESDHNGGNQNYDQNLLEWQSDYEADVQAITGQTAPVPMFTDQMSSFTALGSTTSTIPLQQLAAAAARPDRIFVVAPKYMLAYVPDGVHLTGDGERMLGEYYAKAWRRVLVDGEPWLPVSPRAVQRDGAVITVDFNVPAPPLVLDTTLVTDPGTFGFGFSDTSGAAPTITAVEIVDDDTVRITLSAAPTGGNKRLRYAMTGTTGAAAGPTTGARGNLRDSDGAVSLAAYPLYNWCVHFEEAVP